MPDQQRYVGTASVFRWLRLDGTSPEPVASALLVPNTTVNSKIDMEEQASLDTFEGMTKIHDPGGKVRRNLAADVKGQSLFGGPRREYRYFLRRVCDDMQPAAMFVMMNPSVADVHADGPTVMRCQTFARRWGCGSLYVVNTFAYRATDQRQLLVAADPVGPENDKHILATAQLSKIIVLADGQPEDKAYKLGRSSYVLEVPRLMPASLGKCFAGVAGARVPAPSPEIERRAASSCVFFPESPHRPLVHSS
jgi:hypothetical protein